MNAASASGQAKALRDLLTLSDEWLSPQAAVLVAGGDNRDRPRDRGEDRSLRTDGRRRKGGGRDSRPRRARRPASRSLARRRSGSIESTRRSRGLPYDWRELQAQIEPQYGHLYDKESYGLA